MRNFKKLLQGAKRFETLQTIRKAKDIDEIQTFNLQQEYHNFIALLQTLDAERSYTESQTEVLQESITEEQRQLEIKTNELLDTEAFEQKVFETTANADHFQNISETQETGILNQHAQIKQLPAGSPDPFEHELSDLTETCLQRELEKNDTAIKQPQEEAKKTPKRQTLYIR